MERTKKAWVNAIFFVITLAVNTLGALGLINGLSQKEISDRYVTLITPSPSTFSIWSVIYTLLLAAVIMMIVKKADTYYQKAVDEISLLFRLSSLFNIAAALVKIEWNRFGLSEELWAVIILAVSAVLVILILLRLENVIYPLPVAWAYFGIYQFLNAPEGFKGQYNLVEVTALIGMVVLIGAAAIQLYRNRFRILPVAQN